MVSQVYTSGDFRDCSVVLNTSSRENSGVRMRADSKEVKDFVSLISVLDAVKHESALLCGITSEA